MNCFFSVVFLVIVVCCNIHKGASLECYTCSVQVEPSKDPYSECENFSIHKYENHKKTSCIYGDSVCAKRIISYDGIKWLHRGCHHSNVCNVLQMTHNSGPEQLVECSTCSDRDLCNSSKKLQTTPMLWLFILFVSSIYFVNEI